MPGTEMPHDYVFYVFHSLYTYKSYDPSGIHPVSLKNSAVVLTTFLMKLFRLSQHLALLLALLSSMI